MTAERDLGTIPPDMLARGAVARYFFVRLDLAVTRYYTNCPLGFVGNIDGSGSRTWLQDRSVVVSGLAQGTAAHGEKIDSIALGNGDGLFCTLVGAGGVRDQPANVWIAYFDTDGSLVDSFMMAPAWIDAIDAQLIATIALKAFRTSHGRLCPVNRYSHGAFIPAPAEGDTLIIGNLSTATATRPTVVQDSGGGTDSNFWKPPGGTRRIIPVSPSGPVIVTRSTGIAAPTPATGVHR